MKTFKDNEDRQWSVAINVDAIKRVKSLLDVDLLGLVDGGMQQLVTDPILLCDVVYAVCKPEADSKDITDEQFGRAMAGDAIDDATTALLEETIDFFPKRRRDLLHKALVKLRDVETAAHEVVGQRLDSPELKREIDQLLHQFGDSSGGLPESSASIPVG